MAADRELQDRVLQALDREPNVTPATIGVAVRHGIVTLMGPVATLQARWAAERVAEQVCGVRAVANDLEISRESGLARTSSRIAEEVARALSWTTAIPLGAVKVTVWEGWVTLVGIVDRDDQKQAAEHAVRHISGVKEVFNAIAVRHPAWSAPRVSLPDEPIAVAQ